jgi:hypothetical protein
MNEKKNPIIINEITPEELEKLAQIDRDCIAMHLPCPPKTFINMKVHEGGELVLDYDFRSKSWVRNAHNFLLEKFAYKGSGTTYEAGSTGGKAIGGGGAGNLFYGSTFTNLGIVNNTTYGIEVGTGSSAESFESYALTTLVASGNGSGQLAYSAQNATTMSYESGTKTWTVTFARIFNNNSGGAITITETGMVYYNVGAGNFLFCRDLLASSVEVANTAQLTVTYTMSYTFPA